LFATSVLGLADRGTVQKGSKADLVILRSDPLEDIRHTRDIDYVIVGGVIAKSAGR
jgi:imidazolonepropionase-like amidohydrolase